MIGCPHEYWLSLPVVSSTLVPDQHEQADGEQRGAKQKQDDKQILREPPHVQLILTHLEQPPFVIFVRYRLPLDSTFLGVFSETSPMRRTNARPFHLPAFQLHLFLRLRFMVDNCVLYQI